MSKKPDKRRGAATDSPLLPKLRAILEEYRPLKQAADENDKLFDALEDLAAKQGAREITTIPSYEIKAKGKWTEPTSVIRSDFQRVAERVKTMQTLVAATEPGQIYERLAGTERADWKAERVAYEAAYEAANIAEVQQKEEAEKADLSKGVDPIEERQRIFERQSRLLHRLAKIMLGSVECDECLFTKARLLEIFLNYDEAVDELNPVINFDWRAKKGPDPRRHTALRKGVTKRGRNFNCGRGYRILDDLVIAMTKKSNPKNQPSHLECKATWLDVNAPLYFPLLKLATDWKALKEEFEPLSERISNMEGEIPESDEAALRAMWARQDSLVRQAEELLEAEPKSISCLQPGDSPIQCGRLLHSPLSVTAFPPGSLFLDKFRRW